MALFTSHPDRQTLFEEYIMSTWSITLPYGAGQRDKYFDEVENALTQFELPDVKIKRQEVVTQNKEGKYGTILRRCLFVECGTFKTYFSAQDYGKHIVLSQINEAIVSKMSVFHKEGVSAYLSFIRAAREAAVEKMAKELNQDLSKLQTQSEGTIDIV
jgi:hypothetical protein